MCRAIDRAMSAMGMIKISAQTGVPVGLMVIIFGLNRVPCDNLLAGAVNDKHQGVTSTSV
jgi:hypothetical protein